MSTENDVARSLRSWLRENRHEDANRVLDAVFDQVPATPQRAAGWLARRFPLMNSNFVRVALAAAAVVVIAVVGFQYLGAPNTSDPGATESSLSPTASPSSSPLSSDPGDGVGPLILPYEGTLSGGRYIFEVEGSGLSLSALVPGGWQAVQGPPNLAGPNDSGEPGGVRVGFTTVDGLYQDPCHWHTSPVVVPVGPAAIDLVDVIQASSSFVITEGPQEVPLGSHTGYTMQIKLPDGIDLMECDLGTFGLHHEYRGFSGPGGTWIGYGEWPAALRYELLIVDYHGTRFIAYIGHYDGTPDADLDAARAIVESVEIVSPAALPSCEPLFGCDPLPAGTYETAVFRPTLTFTVPPGGWTHEGDSAGAFTLSQGSSRFGVLGVGVMSQRAIPVQDDCSGDREPGAGDTVQAWVAFLIGHPGLETTEPVPVALGGFDGMQLDVKVAASWTLTCPESEGPAVVLIAGSDFIDTARVRFRILDVAGQTVIVYVDESDSSRGSLEERDAALKPLLDTFQFTP